MRPSVRSRIRRLLVIQPAGSLDDVALHPGWRRALLIAMPFAALAFALGLVFELSGDAELFDLIAYSLGIVLILLLELLLYLQPDRLKALVSVAVSSVSLFFLTKLVYLLFLAAPATDILAEMTETFFWAPVVYVLAFFIPGVKWGRFSVGFVGALTPVISAGYMLTHPRPNASELSVFYALVQLNLASVVMVLLTRALATFQAHLTYVRGRNVVLEQLAYTDTLTGLPNRRGLESALNDALDAGDPFAVLFIDLDRFKRVNDAQGHSAGDDLLRGVAERLTGIVRPADVLARISGDEFVLLARDVRGEASAARVAEKLRGAFGTPFETVTQALRVTASIGFCLYPQDGGDAATLLRHADAAMYRAKVAGRDSLRRFSPADTGTELLRVLEKELQGAADRGELRLLYQPLYSLQTGRMVRVEALLRWQHPTRGVVSPEVFVPLAEESGQILSVGRWVLQNACQAASAWRRAGLAPVTVAVNISPLQFAQPGFLGEVESTLLGNGMTGSDLALEITEHIILYDTEEVVRVLGRLRERGVRIAVDDFGTGYSSLGYLKDLPLDTIKIDRAFISDLSRPRLAPHYAFALVQAIITVAKTLDLEVVAEGVESEEVARTLQELGCHAAQGYFFARPLREAELRALLPLGRGSAAESPPKGALIN